MRWDAKRPTTPGCASGQHIQMLFGFFAGIGLPARDHDIGTCTNKAFGNSPANTPSSAGDNGGAAGEIKQCVEFLRVHGPNLTGQAGCEGAEW